MTVSMLEYDEVIDKCKGCSRIMYSNEHKKNICRSYRFPNVMWRVGKNCPLSDNVKKEKTEKKFIDPIKSSKKKFKKIP